MSRYQLIEQLAATEPVQMFCRVLHVSPRRLLSVAGPGRAAHAQLGACGQRRLFSPCPALRHSPPAGRITPGRIRYRALSTRPQCPRTTVANPEAVVAENLLLNQPAPTAPNQVWVRDITYLPLVGGRWCYLAAWRDTCSRRVVGWHLAQQMPIELVITALEQALTLRQPAPNLIIHADRGSQYTSSACRARIEKAQALASYSRPGNPYDNAQAEAGWSTLKTELLPYGGAFASLEEARLEVAYYLDTYFNLDRRHPALGYRSPHQFERDCLTSTS